MGQMADSVQKTNAVLCIELDSVKSQTSKRIMALETLNEQLERPLSKQEFRAEKFATSDTCIAKLTGIPTYKALRFIFDHVMFGNNEDCMNTLDTSNDREPGSYPSRGTHGGRKQSLNPFNQFFMTLFKLRTGMTDHTISAIFGISVSAVDRFYGCWIRVADERFRDFFRKFPYITMPSLPVPEKIRDLYPKVSMIIDCFGLKIEKPKNPDAARKCYSNYKHAYTVKALIGVEVDGNVCFLSHIYQGAISDPAIVRQSGRSKYCRSGTSCWLIVDSHLQAKQLTKEYAGLFHLL